MSQTLLFDVKGMTCHHCVRSVTEAATSVSGVKRAEVSLDSKTARVEGESVDPNAVIEAIKEEGYEASLRA